MSPERFATVQIFVDAGDCSIRLARRRAAGVQRSVFGASDAGVDAGHGLSVSVRLD
jgi:hypothetical protein